MPSLRDVILEKNKLDRTHFEPLQTFIRCITMGVDDAISSSVADKPGYIWVSKYPDTSNIFQVFNAVVNPLVGLPILVEVTLGKLYQVVGIDYSLANTNIYIGNPLLDNHASTHEWPYNTPNTDAISVYTKALVPFRAYVHSDFEIGIIPARYTYNGENLMYYGEYIDLVSYVPASGYTVRVLVYYDPSIATLQLLGGDIVADTIDPTFVDIPVHVIPISHVQLTGTATALREADLTDARIIIHTPALGTQTILGLFNDLERELTIHAIYGGIL